MVGRDGAPNTSAKHTRKHLILSSFRSLRPSRIRPRRPRGEANLRGHLKIEGADDAAEASEEDSGSSSYVAPEKDKDTQLKYALDLLRASKT